jgi:murein DD-endopeptidase MepM/ murein hydrolase activator NlpD
VNLSYLADDECIDDAALYYSELEVDMRRSIIHVQDEHPDYDEYRFSVGAIGHDPIALIAYLTAVYHDFTFADILHILDEIFAEQYNLQFIPEVEIRTRTEGDAEVEYEWHILNIVLVSKPFSAVLDARMNSEQREHFDLLVESRGLRFYIGSPFDFDWLPYVGSRFGWRIHPITGSRNLHLGIDIGQPTGVEIIAAHAGTVTFAGDMGNYGLVIFLAGDDGIETRYAHCNSLLVSTGDIVSEGQVIATVGSTGRSTGPHLHFEFIRNGRHLNPLLFTANGG